MQKQESKTTKSKLKCFFGWHNWGEQYLVGDHPRFPKIVRESLEYMNMGDEHECKSCGKIERVYQ